MSMPDFRVESQKNPYVPSIDPGVDPRFWNFFEHRVYVEILKVKKYKLAPHKDLDLDFFAHQQSTLSRCAQGSHKDGFYSIPPIQQGLQ